MLFSVISSIYSFVKGKNFFYITSNSFSLIPSLSLGISTHTLRVERDGNWLVCPIVQWYFNSHAPCGAWRYLYILWFMLQFISTHTLRVERDFRIIDLTVHHSKISTHTLRVERDHLPDCSGNAQDLFQLTRSVWSVTVLWLYYMMHVEFQLTRSVWSVTL